MRHKAYLAGKKMPEQYAKPFNVVQFFPDRLEQPLHWKKPRRIGVCFTGDWMDDQVKPEWFNKIWVTMMDCERRKLGHQFFTLTKQAKNLSKIRPQVPMENLYNGVSITDQYDMWMVEELLKVPGKHWISWEPALGPVDFSAFFGMFIGDPGFIRTIYNAGINLVIIGCESGPRRRPCKIEWMIDVVHQCQAAGVPVFVKQVEIDGKVCHDINLFPPELQVREWVK
jgi:protein gp37